MVDQTQLESPKLPKNWRECFILKRIGEENLYITEDEKRLIDLALVEGIRFAFIRNHTLMLNTIKGIDPRYGEDNIPPRYFVQMDDGLERSPNASELALWDKLFLFRAPVGKRLLPYDILKGIPESL